MDHSRRRRKVIKKLDFENCDIATIRVRKGFRRQIKARLIKEYEDDVTHGQQQSLDGNIRESVQNSPILFRKGITNRRFSPEKTPSPVLIKSGRSHLAKRLKMEEAKPSTSAGSDATTSPIFKFKPETRVTGNQSSAISSGENNTSTEEYDIEDGSQDQGNDDCKISNFSSESGLQSIAISDDQSRKSSSGENEFLIMATPTEDEDEDDDEDDDGVMADEEDSAMEGKGYQKGGLLEKLFELRKRRSSERRILEHNRKFAKFDDNRRMELHVLQSWRDATRLILKCQQIDVAAVATEFVYVIANREIGHCYRKIKQGTFLRVAAPWQEIGIPALGGIALLSIAHVEIIDGKPEITTPKKTLREMSVMEYRQNESLLFDVILGC